MKTRRYFFIMMSLVLLFLFGLSPACTVDKNRVMPGEFVIEPPTLISHGFEWHIEGDDNRNAAVKVSYRKKGEGDHAWKEALPLLRLQYEQIGEFVAPNMFAGSIFDLEPDTEYEVSFIMSDPDGIRGKNDKLVSVRTRTEPMPFEGGRTLHVYPYGYEGPKEEPASIGLNRAYAQVQPGDMILVHAGLYRMDRGIYADDLYKGAGSGFFGTYRLAKSGTPGKPVVIKAAGDGEVIFDGNGCFNLFDVTQADYNYFEGLTIRNADIAFFTGLRNLAGCTGLTVKRCRIEDVGMGIYGTYAESTDYYIADNTVLGRDDPTRLIGWISRCVPWSTQSGYPQRIAGPNGSYYGITVGGQGHVVCYNHVAHFHDAIATDQAAGPPQEGQPAPVAIDFYNNFISDVADNCFETDMATQNIRVFRNLCVNHAHASLSSQPVYGGPAYFIRNIVYHAPERGAIKMYMSPAGVIFYHNTLLAEVNVGQASVHTGASNLHFRNNLILGENPESQKNYLPDDFRGIFYMDTYTSYTTSDYNGFRPNEGYDMQFAWNSPGGGTRTDYGNPREVRTFRTLEELCNETGQECNGILVDYDIFQNVRKADLSDFTRIYKTEELDFRLKPDAAAVDKGCILPNVNDDFSGQAPDLGALEVGRPMPHYGPRP